MTVNEAYENLAKLIKKGKGDLSLFGIDIASGVTYRVSIYSSSAEKDDKDTAGSLADKEDGTEYIPVYLD